MLGLACPQPAAPRFAARSQPSGTELDRLPSWKTDRCLTAGGDVSSRRDEPVAGEEVQGLVHGKRFDDAVQVENDGRWPKDEPFSAADGAPLSGLALGGRRPRLLQQREVAVVTGCGEGPAERRVDEAVRGRRGSQRSAKGPREEERDADEPRARGVHAIELTVGAEAAEDLLPALEMLFDRLVRRIVGPRTDDLDTHRLEGAGLGGSRTCWSGHRAPRAAAGKSSRRRSRTPGFHRRSATGRTSPRS